MNKKNRMQCRRNKSTPAGFEPAPSSTEKPKANAIDNCARGACSLKRSEVLVYITIFGWGHPTVGPHLGLHCGFACPRWGTPQAFTAAARFPRWGHRSEARGVPHPPPCPGYRIPHIHSVNVRCVYRTGQPTGVRPQPLEVNFEGLLI